MADSGHSYSGTSHKLNAWALKWAERQETTQLRRSHSTRRYCKNFPKKVEEKFEVDGLGWEHHIDDAGRHWFRYSGRSTWIALLIINISLAVWAIFFNKS